MNPTIEELDEAIEYFEELRDSGRPGEIRAWFDITRNRYYSNAQGGGNAMDAEPVQTKIDIPF